MFGVRPCRPEVGLGGCSCSRHGLSRAACVPCHAMELWREGSNGEGTQGPPWSEERNVRPLCGGNSGSQRLWRACCTQRRRAAVLLTAARARPCVRMAGHGLLLYSSEQCEVLLEGKARTGRAWVWPRVTSHHTSALHTCLGSVEGRSSRTCAGRAGQGERR